MAKTYEELWKICQRRTKTEGDADALAGFKEDLNLGQLELADELGYQDIIKTDTLTTTAGTVVYNVASDVDALEQLRITSPVADEAELTEITKAEVRAMNPVTTNDSNAIPTHWYWDEESLDTSNSRTRQIGLYPTPDIAYTISYSYKPIIPVMTNSTDYPFIPEKYHHHLSAYGIWKYAEREPDPTLNPVYWENQWERNKRKILSGLKTKSKFPPTIPGPDRSVG